MSQVKPANFGEWWNSNTKDVSWYQEIHDARQPVHEAFDAWIAEHDLPQDPIRSVLEIGCGRGVLYPARFADRRYVGYDISRKEIEWCRENRHNPLHDYMVGDFIADGVGERFDLVFAHAVVDHVYDIDAFVRAAVEATNRWVYLTAYRGWFPDLEQHRYNWSEQDTCFYNDLSPTQVQRLLVGLGCRTVQVTRSRAPIQPDVWETVIVAERDPAPRTARHAEDLWLRAVLVCPACLQPGILDNRRGGKDVEHVECRRCRRVYPIEPFGVGDFQVPDRLASLPDGALEMWALAQARSAGEHRTRPPDSVAAWHPDAADAFAGFVDIAGACVLDVGFRGDETPAYVERSGAREYVALDPRPIERRIPYTRVPAWPELMPFADGAFDAVICAGSLDRCLSFESSLRELHRVLRPGGTLYLWSAFVAGGGGQRDLFPSLLRRPAVPETADRNLPDRAAAAREVERRSADVSRLEIDYGHLLVGSRRLRRLPLDLLKSMPQYGFQPEAIDVRDRRSQDGRVFVEAFVRHRKIEAVGPLAVAFAHQVDLLGEAAAALEQLVALSARVRAIEQQTAENGVRIERLQSDTERWMSALHQEIWYPRTPLERLYRRLGKYWRRFVGQER